MSIDPPPDSDVYGQVSYHTPPKHKKIRRSRHDHLPRGRKTRSSTRSPRASHAHKPKAHRPPIPKGAKRVHPHALGATVKMGAKHWSRKRRFNRVVAVAVSDGHGGIILVYAYRSYARHFFTHTNKIKGAHRGRRHRHMVLADNPAGALPGQLVPARRGHRGPRVGHTKHARKGSNAPKPFRETMTFAGVNSPAPHIPKPPSPHPGLIKSYQPY